MSVTLATERVFNFSAGPSTLPEKVLEEIRDNLMSIPGVGASVMEISHRSKEFVEICEDATRRLRELLNLPSAYEVLFLQGGARLQNAMIPMNLITDPEQTADYVLTGSWGQKSAAEVKHFGQLNVAFDGAEEGFVRAPESTELKLTPGASYVHMTSNETIHGVQFKSWPQVEAPLVIDQSSDFLAREIEIPESGLIYACAQKNIGIAGVTIVLISKDLLERADGRLPGYLEYQSHVKSGSMFNTPPTFAVYVVGLVAKWLQETIGGVAAMQKINEAKAARLYSVVEAHSNVYRLHPNPGSRSMTNVVFRLQDADADAKFVAEAAKEGLAALKGHRSVGGIRASIYNGMPIEGVEALCQFMSDFANRQN